MKRLTYLLFVSGLTGILSLGAFWPSIAQADSKRHFSLEVAMGDAPPGLNFADSNFFPNFPRGTVVLSSGNIFPAGTLGSDSDPNAPDAIGVWRCQLVDLGPGDFPLTGAVTYYFRLDATGYDPEESMIIVQGLNSHTSDSDNVPTVEDSVPRVHAVVGGTGKYATVTGEVREEVIGTNPSGSRNLRFEFRLRGVRHHHSHNWNDDDN